MRCNIDQSLLDGLMDDQLSTKEQLEVNTHVVQCNHCQQQLKHMRQIRAQLSTMQAPCLSDAFELKLKQKIAIANGQPSNLVNLEQTTPSVEATPMKTTQLNRTAANSGMWAIAASIAITVTSLSWFMMQDQQNPQQLALDGLRPVIEIGAPVYTEAEVKLVLRQITANNDDSKGFWTDVEVTSFDQFTQVDDGYQTFSCGSTRGDRGCSLGNKKKMASLQVSSSI